MVQHAAVCSQPSVVLVFLRGIQLEAAEHPKQFCSQPSIKATDAVPVSGVLFTAQVLQRHSCLFNLCVGKMVFCITTLWQMGCWKRLKQPLYRGLVFSYSFLFVCSCFCSSIRQGGDKVPEDSAVSEKRDVVTASRNKKEEKGSSVLYSLPAPLHLPTIFF